MVFQLKMRITHGKKYAYWISGIIVGSTIAHGLIKISRFSSSIHDIDYHSNHLVENDINSSLKFSLDGESSNCAEWLSSERRKVLFVELNRWDEYYGRGKYKTGEYYMSATWDYALQKLGFQVDRVSTKQYYERMKVEDIQQYHRIFVRDPKHHRYYNISSVRCKVRPMYFFGDWYYKKNDHNYRFQVSFLEEQILSANPDDHNTFLGYFPHNLILDNDTSNFERGKVGLLYGKKPEYFEGRNDVIIALLSEGFELHTTCKDTVNKRCDLPDDIIRHENLSPYDFAKLMKKFSFILGLGEPVGSPSPLVGLSYGVAFLNPLRKNGGVDTQHKALARLGFPYTYVVDLSNSKQVVQAAEWASTFRFKSYVPPQYRIESLLDRMCKIIEDELF